MSMFKLPVPFLHLDKFFLQIQAMYNGRAYAIKLGQTQVDVRCCFRR